MNKKLKNYNKLDLSTKLGTIVNRIEIVAGFEFSIIDTHEDFAIAVGYDNYKMHKENKCLFKFIRVAIAYYMNGGEFSYERNKNFDEVVKLLKNKDSIYCY